MPNIASILKSEIARVARKEIRGETVQLKKAVGAYRSQIAALKRRAQALEKQLRGLRKGGGAKAAPAEAEDDSMGSFRFSAKGLASHRKRLGLSAHECGILLGASGAIGLQVGRRQGPTPGQALAGHRGAQNPGQEGAQAAILATRR